MNTYKLDLITPSNILFSGNITRLKSESLDGEFEILPNHVNYLTVTIPSKTFFTDETGKEHVAFTSDGVIKFKDGVMSFCCDAAEWPEDIDEERAKRSKERAQNRLNDKSNLDIKRTKKSLLRAETRIEIAEKYRSFK